MKKQAVDDQTPQIPPGLLIPWLALGAGLAAMVNVQQSAPVYAPAAAESPALVTGSVAPGVDGVSALTTAPDMLLPEPKLRPGQGVRFQPGLPSVPGFVAPAQSIDPATLSAPAKIDRMFAVDSGPKKLVDEARLAAPQTPDPTRVNSAGYEPTAEDWAALRWCESSGNYAAVSSSGRYRGAYQFDQQTWESVGGTGDPADATPAEQDALAAKLFAERGAQPWPYCGRYLEPS